LSVSKLKMGPMNPANSVILGLPSVEPLRNFQGDVSHMNSDRRYASTVSKFSVQQQTSTMLATPRGCSMLAPKVIA